MFKSDFKYLADYLVQMRKTGEYVPSNGKISHVRELLQLMAVMTRDHRFEDVFDNNDDSGQSIGEEGWTMCEVLDRVENKGRNEGRNEGRILEHVFVRREDGYSDEEIINSLMKRFGLSKDQAAEKVLAPAIPSQNG